MKKNAFLEFSILSSLAGFGFLLTGILIATILFSLSVPLHQVVVEALGIIPTHLEMVIAVLIFLLFLFIISDITITFYMIIVLFSLWYLVIVVNTIVWLAPAMMGTIVICPLLVYQLKKLFGQIEEH
jgi:hypothetical protein